MEERNLYAYSNYRDKTVEMKKNIAEVVDLLSKGEDVYVRITRGVKEGSIAKISTYTYDPTTHFSSSILKNIRLKWDGLKNNIGVCTYDITWLKNYEGPTVLKIKEPKTKQPVIKVIPKDMLGQEINVGDVILYARSNSKDRFGTVTRVSDKGVVYFNAIASNRTKPRQAYLTNDILVIRDGLKQDLMLMKLTFNGA